MTDDHSHAPPAHSEAHASTPAPSSPNNFISSQMDSVFQKINDYLTDKIAGFVAFLFILIFIGVVFTVIVLKIPPSETNPILLAPLVAAVIAYYNRDIAVILFLGLILIFII
ncbi:MAG: hypothetical protein HY392_04340 [Candidatus Diapherotrites archaeon]|nr:hypothetical protein [Candidatus Diapherotrites archaeon]